jgi:hypothetical protein
LAIPSFAWPACAVSSPGGRFRRISCNRAGSPTASSKSSAFGQANPDLYILEIATYPEARVAHQVLADTARVYLDRQVLPEVVVLFLHPKGNVAALDAMNLISPQGLTDLKLSWRIAKLWEVPAQELLAAGDIGLIPWVPLTKFTGPPEPIIRQCRTRIDQVTSPDEHANLLAVTQFLARLRYNDTRLFEILGGRKAMIESPLLQELKAEWTQEATISNPHEGSGRPLRRQGQGNRARDQSDR